MKTKCDDGYVRSINYPDHIWYAMQILKLLNEFLHDGGGIPSNEFFE
jgi:hypothetical protein